MWKMTIEALEEIGETEIFISGKNLTFLEIYGPGGKIGHYFSQTWTSADDMRSDLMQNHGGGVPISVIDELVRASKLNSGDV